MPAGGPQWCDVEIEPFMGIDALSPIDAYPDRIVVMGSRKTYNLDFNTLPNLLISISTKVRDILAQVCPDQVKMKRIEVHNKKGQPLESLGSVYLMKVLHSCDALVSTSESMFQRGAPPLTRIFQPAMLEPLGDRQQLIDRQKISGLHIWYEKFGMPIPSTGYIFVSEALQAELQKGRVRQVEFAHCEEV